MRTKTERIKQELHRKGVLKANEILQLGISKEYLRKLCLNGVIDKIARGFYVLPGYEISATQSIIEVSKQMPKGVICLLSALRLHEFTTQNPFEVWIAVERRHWKPAVTGTTRTRCMRFSGESFHSGIQEKTISNVTVKVYSPAKTVVDCFKYRNKIGLDVALEALREGYREKLFTIDDLCKFADICRMSSVMRPYLEALAQ